MNLAHFIETYQGAITQAVLRTYPPVYTARNRDEWGFDLLRLRRPGGERSATRRQQRSVGSGEVGEPLHPSWADWLWDRGFASSLGAPAPRPVENHP